MSTQALSFAGAMAFLKLNKIVDAGASFLATLDPQTATEADIKQAENHLTEVLTKRACARREYDTANDASSRAKQNYESEVAGLKVLMDKAASAQGDEKLALNAKVNAFEAELQAKRAMSRHCWLPRSPRKIWWTHTIQSFLPLRTNSKRFKPKANRLSIA